MNLFKRGNIEANPDQITWVVMNAQKTTILLDPSTGQPWWSHSKDQAEIMCKKLAIDFNNKGCFVIPHIEAMKELARKEGVELQPPFTQNNIARQLRDAHLRSN